MTAPKKKPPFGALPLKAIVDPELSDGDLRVLAIVAYHDRMSTTTGSGQGAWASHAVMAERIGRNYARFSTSIAKLIRLGYIDREPRQGNRRQFTYRVNYPTDYSLPERKLSGSDDVCPTANDPDENVCPAANESEPIVCTPPPVTHSNERKIALQEITLSVGRNSGKPWKENSGEPARLASRHLQEGSQIEPGGRLAIVERVLSDPDAGLVAIQECERTVDAILDECGSNFDPDDCTGSWAVRLSDRIAAKKHELEVVHWLGSVEQFLAQHAAPLDPERAQVCVGQADRLAEQDYLPEAVRGRAADLARAVQTRLVAERAGGAKRVRS